MQEDLKIAKSILFEENLTCVFYKDGTVFKSSDRGVSPLLKFYEQGENLEGFCAADKVVGKGAAFLYVLLKVKAVYAKVLSKAAKEVFEQFDIEFFYDENPEKILNREKNGFCPIESAVLNICEPFEALSSIKKRLEELRN